MNFGSFSKSRQNRYTSSGSLRMVTERVACRIPVEDSLRERAAARSFEATNATAAVAAARRSLCESPEVMDLPRKARSIRSPPTRAHIHPAGRSFVRMPAPAVTSRRPAERCVTRARPPGSTPISADSFPGANNCAAPTATLNQPSLRASRSSGSSIMPFWRRVKFALPRSR